MSESTTSTEGGCGCISTILGILLIVAICCGVTYNGRHYGLSGCSCDKGLEIDGNGSR